jgi:hypothetical protein
MKNGIQGIDKLQKSVRAHEKALGVAFRSGLQEAADFLKVESQKLVPLDKGDLEASAHTRLEGVGLNSSAIVAYGAVNEVDGYDYTIIQHENLEYNHAPGRQAKYLEEPARTKAVEIADKMWRRVREMLGRGGAK